jgi:hypothetical protein
MVVVLLNNREAVMDALIIIILGAGAVWYWTLVKGRRTVRAYIYLGLIHRPDITPAEANGFVRRIGFLEATETAREAKSFIASAFGGKQLALLSYARQNGFQG